MRKPPNVRNRSKANIDPATAGVNNASAMKRFYPLLLIVLFVLLLVGGLAWKVVRAEECMEEGGTVIAPMTRGQDCVGQ